MQQKTRRKASEALTHDVGEDKVSLHSTSEVEANCNCWIQVGPRDVSEGVDHCHDNKPESQSHADMGDRTSADIIDDNCTGTGKNEGKGSEQFRHKSFHVILNLEPDQQT